MEDLPIKLFIYDLKDQAEAAALNIEPGIYYAIPANGVEYIEDEEAHLSGPFETTEAAREAAFAFVADAIGAEITEALGAPADLTQASL